MATGRHHKGEGRLGHSQARGETKLIVIDRDGDCERGDGAATGRWRRHTEGRGRRCSLPSGSAKCSKEADGMMQLTAGEEGHKRMGDDGELGEEHGRDAENEKKS